MESLNTEVLVEPIFRYRHKHTRFCSSLTYVVKVGIWTAFSNKTYLPHCLNIWIHVCIRIKVPIFLKEIPWVISHSCVSRLVWPNKSWICETCSTNLRGFIYFVTLMLFSQQWSEVGNYIFKRHLEKPLGTGCCVVHWLMLHNCGHLEVCFILVWVLLASFPPGDCYTSQDALCLIWKKKAWAHHLRNARTHLVRWRSDNTLSALKLW